MPIIHIGYPKTATTWLQERLFPHVSNYHYINKNTANSLFAQPNAFSFDKEAVLKTVTSLAPQKDIIISSELFAGTINRGWLKGFWSREIALRLKQTFPTATILVMLRKQQDMVASAYLQYIKNGGNYSIERYLTTSPYLLFSFEHLRFHHLIQHYESLFGKESVRIYLYEDFKENGSGFTQKLAADLSLDLNHSDIDFSALNVSLPNRLIPLKKFGNAFYYKMFPYKHYIIPIRGWDRYQEKLFAKLSESRFLKAKATPEQILGKARLSYIMNFYKKSNRILLEGYKLEGMVKHNYPL